MARDTTSSVHLQHDYNCASVKQETQVQVSRRDLELEHRLLIARLHLLRRLLGYPALTDKEKYRQATK